MCKNLAFTSRIVVSFLSIPLPSAYLKIAAMCNPTYITYFLIVIVLSISGYLQSLKVIPNPVDNLFQFQCCYSDIRLNHLRNEIFEEPGISGLVFPLNFEDNLILQEGENF